MTKGIDYHSNRRIASITDSKQDTALETIAENLCILNDNLHELIEGLNNGKFTVMQGKV